MNSPINLRSCPLNLKPCPFCGCLKLKMVSECNTTDTTKHLEKSIKCPICGECSEAINSGTEVFYSKPEQETKR